MTAVASPVSAFPVYDLHSHTRASDGLLTPEQLVLRAVQQRVGVLAITDHDTTDGIAPAREAMMRHQLPLRLVDGVEISTLWENHEIHIVGLGIDIAHPQMVALLAAQAERRLARARLIAGRLEKAHIPGALDGALALAEGGPSRAGILRVSLLRPAKPTICSRFSKIIWHVVKPAMSRRSGVQLSKPLMPFINPVVGR